MGGDPNAEYVLSKAKSDSPQNSSGVCEATNRTEQRLNTRENGKGSLSRRRSEKQNIRTPLRKSISCPQNPRTRNRYGSTSIELVPAGSSLSLISSWSSCLPSKSKSSDTSSGVSNNIPYNHLTESDNLEVKSQQREGKFENRMTQRPQHLSKNYLYPQQHPKKRNDAVESLEEKDIAPIEVSKKGDFLNPASDKYPKNKLLRYFSCRWKLGYLCFLFAIIGCIVGLKAYT